MQHIVIDHLSPKVTVGNHLHSEHLWLGRNTEKTHCWFCFSPSNRLTSNTQPAALYKIYRWREEEKRRNTKKKGEGVTEMH